MRGFVDRLPVHPPCARRQILHAGFRRNLVLEMPDQRSQITPVGRHVPRELLHFLRRQKGQKRKVVHFDVLFHFPLRFLLSHQALDLRSWISFATSSWIGPSSIRNAKHFWPLVRSSI